MDIIALVTADHDEVFAQIEQLEILVADDSRSSDAMRLAVKLAVTVKTHAKAEERVLYDAMRTSTDQLRERALEGPYAHQALDMMLDKLVLHRPGPELRAILKVCKGLFQQHARDEEEGAVLPALAAALPASQREQLGQAMHAEKLRLRPQIERLVGPAARGSHDGRGFHIHAHRR